MLFFVLNITQEESSSFVERTSNIFLPYAYGSLAGVVFKLIPLTCINMNNVNC